MASNLRAQKIGMIQYDLTPLGCQVAWTSEKGYAFMGPKRGEYQDLQGEWHPKERLFKTFRTFPELEAFVQGWKSCAREDSERGMDR